MSLSDDLESAGGGLDRPALERFIEEYWPRLCVFVHRHVSRRVRSREETADLVQSAIARVLKDARARPSPINPRQLPPWLFQACKRTIIDRERKIHTEKRDPSREQATRGSAAGASSSDLRAADASVDTPSAIAQARETAARIEAALPTLNSDERTVFQLRLEGMSHAEIGQRIGKSERTVRATLSRAKAHLADALPDLRGLP